jgi:hypothetical protein
MAHGGSRPGAGRPKGARNKKTLEQVEAIVASGLTPLEYLLSVLRDEQSAVDQRMEAAKAAAPYVHPKLANIELSGNEEHPLVHEVRRTVVRPAN